MAKQAAHATPIEADRAELGRLKQKLITRLKRAGFKDPLSTAIAYARNNDEAQARAAEQYAAEQYAMDLKMGLVGQTLGAHQVSATQWQFGVMQAQSAQPATAPDARRTTISNPRMPRVDPPTRGADLAEMDRRMGLPSTKPQVRREGNALVFDATGQPAAGYEPRIDRRMFAFGAALASTNGWLPTAASRDDVQHDQHKGTDR